MNGHSDTSREVEQLMVERWRTMSPTQKVRLVDGMIRDTRAMARAGVRRQFPDADEHEIRMRVAARFVDRELMIAAYGWDPEANVA
jgi:hypothetical protein